MKKLMILVIAAAFALTSFATMPAFAGELTAGDYEEEDEYVLDPSDFEKEYFWIELVMSGSNRVQFFLSCESVADDSIEDSVGITVYAKRNGGKFKKVKTAKLSYYNDGEKTLTINKLTPNTKYTFKFVCKTKARGYTHTESATTWTSPATISKKQVKKAGARYTWKKQRRVGGYLAVYSYMKYLGKNMFGTKVYKEYQRAKIVKGTSTKLKPSQSLEFVVPWSKHAGLYWFAEMGPVKTKKAMVKMLKGESDYIFR